MKTIFDKLNDKGICYAVGVSISTFKMKSVNNNSQDYFIMIKESDKKEVPSFEITEDYPGIAIRDLSEQEVWEFKDRQDEFVKVQHSKDGRVYEIKGNSFKSHMV